MDTTVTEAEVRDVLQRWKGERATILLESSESGIWLARFNGTIGDLEGQTLVLERDDEDEERWVTIPLYFESARIETDHLSIRWQHGTVTVRLWTR